MNQTTPIAVANEWLVSINMSGLKLTNVVHQSYNKQSSLHSIKALGVSNKALRTDSCSPIVFCLATLYFIILDYIYIWSTRLEGKLPLQEPSADSDSIAVYCIDSGSVKEACHSKDAEGRAFAWLARIFPSLLPISITQKTLHQPSPFSRALQIFQALYSETPTHLIFPKP